MLRKFVNSKMMFVDISRAIPNQDVQMFIIQTEKITDNILLIEYSEPCAICDLMPFTSNSGVSAVKDDNKTVDEYRGVILNNDPFNKYSGQTLGFIFDNKDINWVKSYLSKSTNSYIKERVKYLADFYKVL